MAFIKKPTLEQGFYSGRDCGLSFGRNKSKCFSSAQTARAHQVTGYYNHRTTSSRVTLDEEFRVSARKYRHRVDGTLKDPLIVARTVLEVEVFERIEIEGIWKDFG